MAQYNEFRNNAYPYPAKTRDMWQLGLMGGVMVPLFDVANETFPGYTAGLFVRKSLGYTVSMRLSAQYAEAKGYGLAPVNTMNLPSGAARNAYATTGSVWVPNYKMQAVIPSVELMFSLKNILFNQGNPKSNLYLTVGYTPLFYHTQVDALDGSGHAYDFSGVNFIGDRKDIRDAIKSKLDGTYETDAEITHRAPTISSTYDLSKWRFRHTGFIGGGYEFRLGPKASLGLEAKYYVTGDDWLDGRGLQNNGSLTPAKDNFVTGGITLGFNIGNASKKTEPKWFMNPLNYLYSEVNTPQHMKFPTPVLPDADGDGVTDQFDQEPNTPAGAPVDSHGVARDSDGDGVPDYKDKELLTPQKCFPVNADGVGTCPLTCCDSISAGLIQLRPKCDLGMLPSIQFTGKSVSISTAAQSSLSAVAQQLQSNPDCRVRVVGHGASDKRAQQLSWDRTNAVIRYLVEKQGISESRFIFSYGQEGDPNTVDLEGTTEEGPNTVPAPNPQYKKNRT